jgi:protein HIRA/HIR1
LKPLCSISGHEQSVNVVRWSPNGRWLATGSSDGRVGLAERTANPTEFGAAAGSEVWRLRQYLAGSKMEIWDIAWSPDSTKIAGCCHDQNVYVWDIAAGGQLITVLKGHTSVVKGIVWDPIGTFLATQDDVSMIVWKVDGWKLEKQITEPFSRSHATSTFRRPSWTPDGSILIGAAAMVAGSHAPLLIEREKWQYSHFPVGHRSFIGATAANPCIYMSSSGPFLCYALADVNQLLTVWTTQQEHALTAIAHVVEKPITDLRWSPDGSLLIAASLDGTVLVVHFENGELGTSMSDSEKEVRLRQTYGTTTGALFEDPALLALYQERKQRQEEANAQVRSQQLALQQQQREANASGKQTETIVKGRRKIVPVLVSGPESSLPTAPDPTDAFRSVFATGNLKPSNGSSAPAAPSAPVVAEAQTSTAVPTAISAATASASLASTPAKATTTQPSTALAPSAVGASSATAKAPSTPSRAFGKHTSSADGQVGALGQVAANSSSAGDSSAQSVESAPVLNEKKRGRPPNQTASGTVSATMQIDLDSEEESANRPPPAKRSVPGSIAALAASHIAHPSLTSPPGLASGATSTMGLGRPMPSLPLPSTASSSQQSAVLSSFTGHMVNQALLRSPPQQQQLHAPSALNAAHATSANLQQSGGGLVSSVGTSQTTTTTFAANALAGSTSPGPAPGTRSRIAQIATVAKKAGRPRGRKPKQTASTAAQIALDLDDDMEENGDRGVLGGPRLLLPLPAVEKRFSVRIASSRSSAATHSLFAGSSMMDGIEDWNGGIGGVGGAAGGPQGASQTAAVLEVTIVVDEDGFRAPKSSLKFMEGKVTVWQDQLEDKVTVMAGNATTNVIAVGCASGDLYLYSGSGRRTLPTINVSSYPICALEVEGSTLLAVTCDGKLRLWDMALGIAKADTDLHNLMAKHYALQLERGPTEPVLNNRPVAEIGAEDGSVLLQDFVARFAISEAGQALAILYSGHIHGYSTMLASWTTVYAPNWQKDVDKHGVALGSLSTLQRTAQRATPTNNQNYYSSYASMAIEERRQRSLAHLEAQLAAMASFGTATEYRQFARLYVRELSELLYEKKLSEFTNALMGPIHHSLAPNSSWDPFIHGYPKRDILEEVLPEMLRPELQRMISIIKENLHNAKTLPVAQRLRSPPPSTSQASSKATPTATVSNEFGTSPIHSSLAAKAHHHASKSSTVQSALPRAIEIESSSNSPSLPSSTLHHPTTKAKKPVRSSSKLKETASPMLVDDDTSQESSAPLQRSTSSSSSASRPRNARS